MDLLKLNKYYFLHLNVTQDFKIQIKTLIIITGELITFEATVGLLLMLSSMPTVRV